MDVNAQVLAALNTGITAAFNASLTGTETTYQRIAMTVKSSTKSQGYPKLSEIASMREWVGDRQIQRLDMSAFQITNRKFENTIAVAVDDIADDNVGLYATFASDFGQTAAELPDELVWEQLAMGFDTAHYDGQYFFDTDHPVVDADGVERSVANYADGAGSAWYLIDTTKVIRPLIFQDRLPPQITPKTSLTDDNVFHQDQFLWGAKRRCATGFGAWELAYASKQALTAENYAAARAAMMSMRGHKGRKLNIRPSLLVVAPTNEGAAREILQAERDAAGATNVWRGTAELHVETRLS